MYIDVNRGQTMGSKEGRWLCEKGHDGKSSLSGIAADLAAGSEDE